MPGPTEKRKIISNTLGMVISLGQILYLLFCTGFSMYQFMKMFTSYEKPEFTDASFLRHSVFLGLKPLEFFEGDFESVNSICLILYAIMCLTFMYVPLRAIIQPSFTAGKVSILQLLPLVVPFCIRISIEIIYFKYFPGYIARILLNSITFSLEYATTVFEIYRLDDDNIPKGTYNMKPWILEPISVTKSAV